MTSFLVDLRAAARALLARPGFALAAIAALALGTGANTMLFGVARGVLLRPLPYAEPSRVLVVTTQGSTPEDQETELSPAELADVRAGTSAFEVVSGVGFTSMDLTDAASPDQLRVGLVLDGFFRAAGIRPIVGRAPTDEEARQGAPVVVLSEGVWRSQFAADPNVAGRTATLDGKPYTIVGVAPRVWFPTVEYDAWLPATPAQLAEARRDQRGIVAFARLRPGATADAAREELAVLGRRLVAQYPKESGGRTFHAVTVREWEGGRLRAAVFVLLGAVALVLLVACTNVAHMLLARASSRQRELAVRASLGATRARLARLLVAEGLALALAGGAAGAVLAALLLPALLRLAPLDDVQREAARLDPWVLLASLGVAALTGVLAGLWPALRASGARPQAALAAGAGRSATAREGWRTRGALVASEVALASVLLAGAGLLLKSFDRLLDVELGYDPSLVVTTGLVLPPTAYPKAEDRREFLRAVRERLRATPGVEVVAAANFPAFMGGIKAKVRAPGQADEQPATWRVVTEDYFEALRVPVLAGRAFDDTDRPGGPPVVVINRTLAERLFPGQNPVGREFRVTRFGPPEPVRVVGVVADTRPGYARAPEPELSVPYAQDSWSYLNLVVRGRRTTPEALLAAVAAAVRAVDPARPTFATMRMDEAVAGDLRQPRFGAALLASFALVAAVLAVLGVVAVTAYAVGARTREIGIRVALGGRPSQVLGIVLRPALRVVLAGAAAGIAGAAAASRLLASQLHGVSPLDPQVLGLTALGMAAVGVVACVLPARRALRVAPTEALRGE